MKVGDLAKTETGHLYLIVDVREDLEDCFIIQSLADGRIIETCHKNYLEVISERR